LCKSSDPGDYTGFHSACDWKANTLVLARSKEGNIFGGFAVPAWDSPSACTWKADATKLSFLFMLKKTFGAPPTRFPLRRDQTNAIWCDKNCGPAFNRTITIVTNPNSSVWVDDDWQDKLGRGTAAFVSSGTGFQHLEVDSCEVWAAAGPPTPCT
jgi:hypothetical protein